MTYPHLHESAVIKLGFDPVSFMAHQIEIGHVKVSTAKALSKSTINQHAKRNARALQNIQAGLTWDGKPRQRKVKEARPELAQYRDDPKVYHHHYRLLFGKSLVREKSKERRDMGLTSLGEERKNLKHPELEPFKHDKKLYHKMYVYLQRHGEPI